MVRSVALSTVPVESLAAAWNGVYSDYAVPMTRDADQLSEHLGRGSVDPAAPTALLMVSEGPAGWSLLAGAAATPHDPAAAAGRLAAHLAGAGVRIVNEPDDSPLLPVLEAAGARRKLTQHAMTVDPGLAGGCRWGVAGWPRG